MIVGSISENKEIENRISITPELAKKYISNGIEILIEKNYGSHIKIPDNEFLKEGCKIDTRENILKQSNIVLQINLPEENSLEKFKENCILIGNFNSTQNLEKIKKLKTKNISVFSLELLPRITRAQSMDILSSQANLAGYKAVVDTFSIFKKAVPMMMTAAGTIPAAKVLVVGAGVAGLAAIANAKRMGAQVYAFDVSDKTNPQLIAQWSGIPNSHACWVSDDGNTVFDIDYLAGYKIECFSSGIKKFGWTFKIIGEHEVEVKITDEPEISPFTLIRKK